MRVDIGDVELPILSTVEESRASEIDEIKDAFKYIDNVAVAHEGKVQSITIIGFINEEMHSQSYSLDEQKKDLKSLRTNSDTDNDINFFGYKGYLIIEEVNIVDDSSSKIIRPVEIEAKYHPWPKFYSDQPEPT